MATSGCSDDGPIWSIAWRGDAAVLTMNGWRLYSSQWDRQGRLDAEVDRLVAERVPRLVVDLRRNEGGHDCVYALIARRPCPAAGPPSHPPRRPPAAYDTWNRASDRLGEKARPYDDRSRELAGTDRDATVIAPKGGRYMGRLDGLVGPQNSSATFGFAQMVRRERRGR